MFKPCFMFSAIRLCSKNNTDGGSFRVFAVRQWDVRLPRQSPQPPERSRKSPQAGFAAWSSASSVPSVETERPIRLINRFFVMLTLPSVTTESMFLAPIIWLFLIRTHLVNIESLCYYHMMHWDGTLHFFYIEVVNNQFSWLSSTGLYTGHTVLNHCVQNQHYFAGFKIG